MSIQFAEWSPGSGEMPTSARHRMAAALLDGQPFGFTRSMAVSCRHAAQELRKVAQPIGPLHAFWDTIFGLEETADRIDALLLPEGSEQT